MNQQDMALCENEMRKKSFYYFFLQSHKKLQTWLIAMIVIEVNNFY